MTIRGVILDVDGTLVSSNNAHAQAWVQAFADFDYSIEFEQVRPLIGMGSDQVIPRLVPGLSKEEGDGKAIAERRKEIVQQLTQTLEPTPGTRDLIERMLADQLQLIIATSASSQELSGLLKAAQVDDLLTEATTSSDATASKPNPDIVQAALTKIQLQPIEVVMLGDTPYDIQSANAAGVEVIAFRSGGFPDDQLQDAIALYNDPADLLAHYDRSPLGQKELVAN